MRATQAFLALTVATLLVSTAVAQTPPTDITVTAVDSDLRLTPDGGAQDLKFTASAGCGLFADPTIVAAGGDATFTLDVEAVDGFDLPSTIDVDFSGGTCITGMNPTGYVSSGEQTLSITPTARALGENTFQTNITFDGEASGSLPFKVDYRKGYFFDVKTDFPIQVEGDKVSWDVDLVINANADTMVMMFVESTNKAVYGNVDGLFVNSPQLFFPTADDVENGMVRTVTFSYTPTSEEWTEDSITFTTWSHWLGDGTMKTDDEVVTWTFENAHADGDHEVHCETDENGVETCEETGIPSIGLVPVIMGLLGAALVAARRRN